MTVLPIVCKESSTLDEIHWDSCRDALRSIWASGMLEFSEAGLNPLLVVVPYIWFKERGIQSFGEQLMDRPAYLVDLRTLAKIGFSM